MPRAVAVLPGLVLATLTVCAAGQQGSSAAERVRFRDVAATAGLAFTHVNGASPDKHFAEIMGSGALFFDVDNDGWIDVLLVDGGSKADPAVARPERVIR